MPFASTEADGHREQQKTELARIGGSRAQSNKCESAPYNKGGREVLDDPGDEADHDGEDHAGVCDPDSGGLLPLRSEVSHRNKASEQGSKEQRKQLALE